jgi:MFS transporter, NNP family, nitrate/nitrite transporter
VKWISGARELILALLVLIFYAVVSKEAPGEVKRKKLSDYWTLLKDPDAHWFCFYYTISFGGFVGLASSYVLYFKGEYGGGALGARWPAPESDMKPVYKTIAR